MNERHHGPHRGRNHDTRMVINSKSSIPVLFVALLLVSVHMSVTNIKLSAKTIPDVNTYDSFASRLDEMSTEEKLQELTSSKRSPLPCVAVIGSSPTFNPSLLSVRPNANNTVISIVSMGGLVDTFLAERCIRSIRRRGLFSGTIMVFTDNIGYNLYQNTIVPWDDKTIIIQAHEEDLHPREQNNGDLGINNSEPQLKKYAQNSMIFKRFKTIHSKYIMEYPALSDFVRYVIYIDVDNVVGNRLDIFFEEYVNMVRVEYERATNRHQQWKLNTTGAGNVDNDLATESSASNFDTFGFISMFKDKHLRGKMHGGIILYDVAFEERCVDGWRNEMDTFWHSSDQIMMLRVLGDYNRYRCTVFALPQRHMTFINKQLMIGATEERQKKRKKKKPMQFPTFIHATKFRVNRINNATIHDEFVRHLLHLNENEQITDSVVWEDTVPSSAKRRKTENI